MAAKVIRCEGHLAYTSNIDQHKKLPLWANFGAFIAMCTIFHSRRWTTTESVRKLRKKMGSAERVNTDVPSIVTEYNNYMGGVDKADQMKATCMHLTTERNASKPTTFGFFMIWWIQQWWTAMWFSQRSWRSTKKRSYHIWNSGKE